MSAIENPTLPQPMKRWFEPVAATLMALSSLSTAWCSYQSTRWTKDSSGLSSSAARLERQAVAWYLEGQQIESVQVRMFMQATDAKMLGNDKLAEFYTQRFAGELKPAYEKWLALNPFGNPAAAPHPFVPGLYKPRFEDEIAAANREAGRKSALSNVWSATASGYLGIIVVLASVLFFAGTAGKFEQRHVRQGSLAFALALFLYSGIRILAMPVN